MKKILTLLTALHITISACAQNKTFEKKQTNIVKDSVTMEISKPPYILGSYQIDPNIKTISVYEMVGGSEKMPDGSILHWDGYQYTPDKKINYKKTTLYTIGKQIFFKEHLKKKCDFNSFKLLHVDDNCLIYQDKNAIYTSCYGDDEEKIDTRQYEFVTDYLYRDKKGNYYVLPYLTSNFELDEIGTLPDIDIESLQHIAGNYYFDKNGLYYLGKHYRDSQLIIQEKLEDSDSKNSKPLIYKDYFIYGKNIYAINDNAEINELDLNIYRINEFKIDNYYKRFVISDGENTYYSESNGYTTDESLIRWKKERLNDDFFWKDVNRWQIICLQDIYFNRDTANNTLYFESIDKPFSGRVDNFNLIYKQNKYYAFDTERGNYLKIYDKIYIRNYDTKKYEELNPEEYRYINECLYVYKNKVYYSNGRPIKESINAVTLRPIKESDFLTDGNCLIYTGNMTGYSTDDSSGDEQIIFGADRGRIKYNIDLSKLKVINQDVLYDGTYIYQGSYNGIAVIPIHELGFDVKLFTIDK